MRRAVLRVLCAVLLCAGLGVPRAAANTRVWWAHVPLDSLHPAQTRWSEPLRLGRHLGALRLSGHLAVRPGNVASGAPIWGPELEPPGARTQERVRWRRLEEFTSDGSSPWVEARGDSTVFDSVAYWRHTAECAGCPVAARRQVASLALADGDTLAADSILASPALARSVWAWPVRRQRAELALASGDTARADSLLEATDRGGWPEAERAAWLALRVRLRTDLQDTTRAIGFARQALSVYPSLPATRRALALLEELLARRGDSLGAGEQRMAAEVEVFAGRSALAAGRLRRVVADPAAGAARWPAALRLCEVLRGARRFAEARTTAESLLRTRVPPELGTSLGVERARAELGAGHPDSALAIYARLAAEDSLAAVLGWEAGRAAEDAGRWDEALRWYGRVPSQTRRGREAAFRAGLLLFAMGRPDSAAARWAPDSSDGARFWCGTARRALGDTTAGDSILREVAGRPGYSFYRAAARDTLALRGWSGGVAAESCASEVRCAALSEVNVLIRLGLADDATALLSRWAAGDARLVPGPRLPIAPEWLFAARQAYGLDRVGLGISLAERARVAGADLEPRLQWDIVPWEYPPACESLFVAPRDTVVASLEPSLLFALTRQESVFDPRARSRSDALGLMQLKLSTATDMARLARDPAPTEVGLFEAETNVRYGARYLRRLLRRFDGSVAAALSAYNAGPGSLSPRWRELRTRGGEALLCELASNPLAQDYAKRILGFRQAYRELRPTTVP